MGEIYLVTNKINDKKYVGQTKNTTLFRWKQHIQSAKTGKYSNALDNAIRKYGADAFEVKRILKSIPESDLDRLECIWIKKFNSQRPAGYNITFGGGGVRGFRHSQATKAKLSKQNKGKRLNHGDLVREGQIKSGYLLARSKNPMWRERISKSRSGRFTGVDNPFYGKHHTEDTKAHLSDVKSKPILMFDLDGNFIRRFKNGHEARDYLIKNGITNNKSCNTPISHVCNGTYNRKSAYGYIWKFDEDVTTNCRGEDKLHLEAQSTQFNG